MRLGAAKLRDIFHRYHPFYEALNDNTQVYYVGSKVTAIQHDCSRAAQAGRGVVSISISSKVLKLQAPSHNTLRAAACLSCDIVWVGEEDNG